ncbi:mechanosensitive ion channel family protein [Synechococcus sp. 1G10]|uniref:mechanosensitive ion channel family protein n=1 Tax=Synechococcus sp. 1G10 TaxID=2025605 RepID=UPI000B99B4ED|nr:mechanosensitive ion channel family protein [Synechococcus sp. 1G10]
MTTTPPVWIWGIGLAIAFPLVTILLGEVIHRLKRRGRAVSSTVRLVRDVLLPLLVLLLFLQHLVLVDPGTRLFRTVETVFWVCVIHASLSLLNVILFEQAEADTWRSRVPKLLIDLARLFLILLGSAFVLATVWKADLAGLVTALGVSSIVIGLALQDTLGSVMSGIALLFERPFTVGDWLEVSGVVGQVIDINWRAVRLLTLEQEMVVIPHKLISSEIIRNFTKPTPVHAERIQIGFSYNDPPNLARQVLKSTALETKGILLDPEPDVFTLAYEDSAVSYEVKFFIRDYGDIEQIRERFMTRVWYAAKRNNLTIPFPIRTVYNFHGPTSQQKGIAKKFSESLEAIPSYVPLNREQQSVTTASSGISLQHFAAGEKVIRQGQVGNELYIIVAGQALMSTRSENGDDLELLSLRNGEFFGEMGLFSGEPSVVTISASNDLEVMKISAAVVNQMIDRQPSFAREIGQILEIRRLAIQETTQAHHQSLQ